jgi:hypothetical protein
VAVNQPQEETMSEQNRAGRQPAEEQTQEQEREGPSLNKETLKDLDVEQSEAGDVKGGLLRAGFTQTCNCSAI